MTSPTAGSRGRVNERPETLNDVIRWLRAAPPGTILDSSSVLELLEPLVDEAPHPMTARATASTWRERLWTVPSDTRIGVTELSEAIGRSASWIYRRTGPSAGEECIPHSKLGGELVFIVAEVRDYLRCRSADGRLQLPSLPDVFPPPPNRSN